MVFQFPYPRKVKLYDEILGNDAELKKLKTEIVEMKTKEYSITKSKPIQFHFLICGVFEFVSHEASFFLEDGSMFSEDITSRNVNASALLHIVSIFDTVSI